MIEKIKKSKQIIREISKKSECPLIVNFSGGRDSCCVLILTLEVTKNVKCLYMKSGLDLPGSIEFVERQCKRFNVELIMSDPVKDYQGDFIYWVKRFGYFPSFTYTWCSSRLKLRPARAMLRKMFGFKTLYKLTGVRRDESTRRVKIYGGKTYIEKDCEHSGSFMVHPILHWSKEDVIKFLKMKKFEINENYKPFGVSGCYYCPFYQKSIYFKIMKVYPDIYDEIIKVETKIGKPSVAGNRFLKDVKKEFLEQRTLS